MHWLLHYHAVTLLCNLKQSGIPLEISYRDSYNQWMCFDHIWKLIINTAKTNSQKLPHHARSALYIYGIEVHE